MMAVASRVACVASVSVWFRSKEDREGGFSVLTAREMKRELPPTSPSLLLAPFLARSLTLVPRSLLIDRTETLATQAISRAIR